MLLYYLLLFCRITIGLIFITSFISKVSNIAALQHTIAQLFTLPSQIYRLAALLILGIELMIVVLVTIGGQLLIYSFALAILLLITFTLTLIFALRGSKPISCNCFGARSLPISRIEVFRNLGLLTCAVSGLKASVDSSDLAGDASGTAWITIGFIAVATVAIWTHLSELMQFISRADTTTVQ